MPQKYFEDQFDDEEVLFVFRKHPIVMRRGLIVMMVTVLLGMIPSLLNPDYTVYFMGLGGGLLLGFILAFPSWMSWYFSVFIVTNQRFIQITQKGMFHRSVVDMGLNQVQMVNYEVSGLSQTLFGFGTIMMQTFVGDLVIRNIHHPARIQKKVLEILRSEQITPQRNDEDNSKAQEPASLEAEQDEA